jgi:primase-polymerase (primpol)-like protein
MVAQPAEHAVGRSARMIVVANLPREIRSTARAVVWRAEIVNGRLTKVPYQPRRPTRRASVTDPRTWGTFAAALAVVRAGQADGVGIMLGGGLCGVDQDHVRDASTGTIAPEAAAIVQRLNSYTEVSPSGTGLHTFAWGSLPPGGRRKGAVELYERDRYFTVTGAHVPGTPQTIEHRTRELAALHRRIFGTPASRSAPRRISSAPDLDDARLIEQALKSPRFAALWNGDTSAKKSHSEADAALCSMLAFWTRGDAARVDRLFRQSGLYRPKWDRVTYREPTIAFAVGSALTRMGQRA